MPQIHKPKQKAKSSPYSDIKPNNYQTVYIKKYNVTLTVEIQDHEEQSDLESLIKNIEESFEKIQDKKIINLEDRLKKSKDGKYIFPEDYKNPERERDNIIYYPEFLKNKEKLDSKESLNRDPKSGAAVIYVPQSSLPSTPNGKVLGMYVPSTHTIYISKDLLEYRRSFVYHHEVAHALGIEDEMQADNYAAGQVGYNLRSPEEAYALQRIA